MQPPIQQQVPFASFLGVAVQLGGVAMLIALFLTLRRFVLRRAYFTAWARAWVAIAAAILLLIVRHALGTPAPAPDAAGGSGLSFWTLDFLAQASRFIGLTLFMRGALTYRIGNPEGVRATRHLWLPALFLAAVSVFLAHPALDRLVLWQSVVAAPAFVFSAWAFLSLPRPRRTAGTLVTGLAFGLLALTWCLSAAAFSVVTQHAPAALVAAAGQLTALNAYVDLTLNGLLGYAMILLLMEDAKREVDDAQSELRLTHDRLRRAALSDQLTESLNRRAFAEGVGLEMVRATFGTVVIADLDNLKRVNDQFGHAVGDQLIRACADALRGALRQYDKLYRWGGDEFLVVLPSAHASNVLERLREAVEKADPVVRDPPDTVWLEVSFGAADYASSQELAEAIERADRAMYREKGIRKSGRRTSGAIAARAVLTPTSARAVR